MHSASLLCLLVDGRRACQLRRFPILILLEDKPAVAGYEVRQVLPSGVLHKWLAPDISKVLQLRVKPKICSTNGCVRPDHASDHTKSSCPISPGFSDART